HVTRPSVMAAHIDGFLQMPAGEVGRSDVTHFAIANQLVKRAESFVNRSCRIKGVHVIHVNVVRAQALERTFNLLREMITRRANCIRIWPGCRRARGITESKRGLGGDKHALSRQML